jgi:hypothetical protein
VVVTEASAHTEIDAEVDLILIGRFDCVHRIGRDHHGDPHIEGVFGACDLVGSELDRCLADPSAADAGLLHARDALRDKGTIPAFDRASHPSQRHRIYERVKQELGLLTEEAGGPPGGIADDVTTLGHVLQVELGKHRGVDNAHVAGRVLEPHPMLRRSPIQRFSRRVATDEFVLVVAVPDDPTARR